jgi:membrane protein implicated in regulation of membrane protease activity
MVGMWLAFFSLLVAGRLDDLWSVIRHLPLLLEIVLWVGFLPWMLGTAVWTTSWAVWLRLVLVLCFAVGWTLASLPRARRLGGPTITDQPKCAEGARNAASR